MEIVYALLYDSYWSLYRQLAIANLLLIAGYFAWVQLGARTSLGDWDSGALRYLPLWVIGVNVALVVFLG